MLVQCIGTGSSGNALALYSNSGKIFLLDLGLSVKEIKKAINFRTSDIAGAVVTHEHSDHSKSLKDFENMGVKVFKPYAENNGIKKMQFNDFYVQCFQLPHNGTTNFGFYIKADNQKLLYMTDFEYCPFIFKKQNINHILIECNYIKEMIGPYLVNLEHKVKGHCSLDTCKGFVEVNKTSYLRTVLLLHMGYGSDDDRMIKEVKEVAGNKVFVDCARPNMKIELNECPF